MCVHTCGPTIFLRSLIFTIQRSTDLGPVLYFFQFDSLGASLKVHVEEIHASLLQKALHVVASTFSTILGKYPSVFS